YQFSRHRGGSISFSRDGIREPWHQLSASTFQLHCKFAGRLHFRGRLSRIGRRPNFETVTLGLIASAAWSDPPACIVALNPRGRRKTDGGKYFQSTHTGASDLGRG